LPKNDRLKAISAPFMEEAERAFEASGTKQRRFHEIQYGAKPWDRERKTMVKAERLAQGPTLRFGVTKLEGEGRSLYDPMDCARGAMKNRIKEQQLGRYADRTSCSKRGANPFRLLLSSAPGGLMPRLGQTALAGPEPARAQVSRSRSKLIRIAARVAVSARGVVLHLSSRPPRQARFRQLVQRLSLPGPIANPPPTAPVNAPPAGGPTGGITAAFDTS
jgi:hypothetical protein